MPLCVGIPLMINLQINTDENYEVIDEYQDQEGGSEQVRWNFKKRIKVGVELVPGSWQHGYPNPTKWQIWGKLLKITLVKTK